MKTALTSLLTSGAVVVILSWSLGCEMGVVDDYWETDLEDADDSGAEEELDARFSTAKNLSNSLLRQMDTASSLQNSNSIQYPFCIYTVRVAQNAQTESNVLSWATKAMNTWISPLQGQPGWKVKQAQAYNVARTSSGCPSTHNGLRVYSIEISDMQGANNQMPGFVMRMGGWGLAYVVVLHEMGHGIGLGDGYVYSNGSHTPVGQPTSIMKDAWNHNGVLQQDDIDGIRFLWARIRGDSNTCPPGYVLGACTGSMCNAAYYCVKGSGTTTGGGTTTTTGTCVQATEGSAISLSCPSGQVIGSINFASYGTPNGSCPSFSTSSCHASTSKSKVESSCLNKQSCTVSATNGVFGDPCQGTKKKLAVTYSCRNSTTTAALSAKDFVGYYERSPVQNSWHKVNISLENNVLKWKNSAGVVWSLKFENNVLQTSSDCPYGATTITVEKQGTNTVTGLRFNGELYQRR
jgi:hypothetical protein